MPPLIQSPKKKAFEKNVATEMDAHPDKKDRAQNLAIAYSVQRKNRKKMAGGGDVKGVHQPMGDTEESRGVSGAGFNVRGTGYGSNKSNPLGSTDKTLAKEKHQKVLSEMRSMPKPNFAAGGVASFGDRHPDAREHGVSKPVYSMKGGASQGPRDRFAAGGLAKQVIREGEESAHREMTEPTSQRVGSEPSMNRDERLSDSEMEHDRHSMFKMAEGGDVKGVHKPMGDTEESRGVSGAGFNVRGTGYGSNKSAPLGSTDKTLAKEKHQKVLSEMRSMPKPNFAYGGESILDEEMPDDIDPRAGGDPEMHEMEGASLAEQIRDKHMRMSRGGMMKKHMAHGGLASNEWPDAGRMGFGMMETENDPDEYSKEGIINYAHGGLMGDDAEERREITEPTQQRLGSEHYLDELEYPMEYHSRGAAEEQEDDAFAQENPSIAESVRRKYMARGGYASGGDVKRDNTALDQNAIEHTNYMNKLNRQLGDHEMYSEESALNDLEDPESDGMDDRDIGTDHYDMVDSIRRKYMRDRMMGSR